MYKFLIKIRSYSIYVRTPNFGPVKPLSLAFGLAFSMVDRGPELVKYRASSLVASGIETYPKSQAGRPLEIGYQLAYRTSSPEPRYSLSPP